MTVYGIHRIRKRTPPGGGACWWCSRKLYRRYGGAWHYLEILENGHRHAVHISQCTGRDAGLRPEDVRVQRTSEGLPR